MQRWIHVPRRSATRSARHRPRRSRTCWLFGQKEEEEKTVSVRSRFAGDEGASSVESFIESIQKEIEEKNLRETVKADELNNFEKLKNQADASVR